MKDSSQALPARIDLAIVGAGPQALTLTTHLLQKRSKLRQKFIVFDPSGTWMSQWRHQFAAQKIPHLRSPAVHHPDPNPHALRRFAENRRDELFPPYDLPGTKLFEEFCVEVIHRWELENRVYPGKISQILPIKHRLRPHFRLVLADGQSLIARRVVLATGGNVPQFPGWVERLTDSYPRDRLCHSQQVDLCSLHLSEERILIVGGGLTAGHLAVGAIAQGATVMLLSRRHLQEKLFDAEPGWLGPKYLKGFAAETDWHVRWKLIQQARNGGSMTPAMMVRLRRLAREGKLVFNERCEVVEAAWQSDRWQVRCADGELHEWDPALRMLPHLEEICFADRIWLATGTILDAKQHPLLRDVLATYPTEIVRGLPVLDEYLRLPGSEFFVMGGLAALQVGPVARNLAGGRKASELIVPALTKPSLAF
ncbi:SidA/IucD/PvdA family monooxygenase [Pleurocapsales cyanobacterium LEGE 06147]|nr:SidA/IucD/PvdA family monooxygenase [Pleurocapsales cyanobacterium LEGE 06147]